MGYVEINNIHEFTKTFDEKEVVAFAQLSEDNNPIHLDEVYAANTIFKQKVVHGVLLVSMFSKIFGTIYPGEGGIYLSQNAQFLRPVFVGEQVKSCVTLRQFDEVKKRGVFLTECFKENGQLAVKGEATILFPAHFQVK